MQSKIVSSVDLLSEKRWNPRFYVRGNIGDALSRYPLIQVGEMVNERREFLQPHKYPERMFNYIGLENIESLTGALVDFQPRKGQTIRSRSKVYRLGDTLYGRLRPTLNKALVIDQHLNEGICSTELFVLIPKEDIVTADLLRVIITSEYVVDIVGSLTAGAALPRIQLDDFMEIKVPCPPIDVQRELTVFINEVERQWAFTRANSETIPGELHNAIWASLVGGNRPEIKTSEREKEVWSNLLPEEDFKVERRTGQK